MKKILLLFLVCVSIISCTDNKVEAYAREKCHDAGVMDKDIKSIKAEQCDSLLGTSYVVFCKPNLSKTATEYLEGKISKEKYDAVIDDYAKALDAISAVIMYGKKVTESTYKLDKYKDCWRKTYQVTVTMKSGVEKSFRVIVDKDGTPMYTEGELQQKIQEYSQELLDLNNSTLY